MCSPLDTAVLFDLCSPNAREIAKDANMSELDFLQTHVDGCVEIVLETQSDTGKILVFWGNDNALNKGMHRNHHFKTAHYFGPIVLTGMDDESGDATSATLQDWVGCSVYRNNF